MSYLDPPGWPESHETGGDDDRYDRQRARHPDAAPDAYPGSGDDGQFRADHDRWPGGGPDGWAPAAPAAGWPDPATQHGGWPEPAGTGAWDDPATGAPGPWGEPGATVQRPWSEPGATAQIPAVTEDPHAGQPYSGQPYAGQPYAGQPYAGQPYQPGPDDTARYEPIRADDTARFEPVRVAAPAGQDTATGPAQTDAPAGRSSGEPAASPGRAGRNLPAAIGVGVGLGAVVIASLFIWRPAFLAVVVAAICVATWELARAVRPSGARPPMVPLVGGGVAMAVLAWFGGAEALTLGLAATVLAAMVWRLADGPAGYQRDLTVSVLIAVYLPFLGGFAVLLLDPPDGAWRVLVTIAGVVLSDTGGYIAGVFLGKHPMAPSVSPKKSWEGFGGSLLASAVGGALLVYFVFHVSPWYGALLGICVAAASVVGDLAESLLKRDLGIKDMSNLLPGHGGLMDRLDSVLFALPVGYTILALVAPATG